MNVPLVWIGGEEYAVISVPDCVEWLTDAAS
jgi:hypothetical protein